MDKKQILHIASLAKLSLDAEEITTLQNDLSRIVDFVELINQADKDPNVSFSRTEDKINPDELCNVYRSDEKKSSLDRKEIEKLAPQFEAGHIVVPSVLE